MWDDDIRSTMNASHPSCDSDSLFGARAGGLERLGFEDYVFHRPEPVPPPTDDDDEDEDEEDDRGSSGGNIDPDDDEGDFDDDDDDEDETLWTSASRFGLTGDGYR